MDLQDNYKGFQYISKKGNIHDLTLSKRALEQFIKRFKNLNSIKLSEERSLRIIRKLFDNARKESNNPHTKERQKRYEKNYGENTAYLENSGWRFVCSINEKIIKTIECYGKFREGNIRQRIFKKDDPNRSFEDGLKELKKELEMRNKCF